MPLQLPRCKLSPESARRALTVHGMVQKQSGALTDQAGALTADSRVVAPGDLFLAYRGVQSDGHAHLAKAAAQGAALLIVEDASLVPAGTTTPWISVGNGRAA